MVKDHENFNFLHFLILVHLLSNGGKNNYLEVTSSQMSRLINRSQQTASKVLIDLERENLIERVKNNKKFGIKLTDEGYQSLKDIYEILKKSMEVSADKQIIFKGKIVTGMGEGAYYMSLEGYRKQFYNKLGYKPFPGTLNVKLIDARYINSRRDLINHPSIHIDGFRNSDRTFGWVKCYTATITAVARSSYTLNSTPQHYKEGNVHVLLLERTHHDNSLIEVIGPHNIKETLKLKDGDNVVIKIRE
ncbi:conserved protein of unknown function [Candidatus Nitrosocosmicus franklandus]|uniref:Riboflavin kinase n=2 Tax=Candidatus Nitrosocosmicus franklandianus TaxID=1798806 RepID=A0A484II10_9ARCH|nr:conserved protein of unknown function [Candidatus Nitrosocosmicus franklandus]